MRKLSVAIAFSVVLMCPPARAADRIQVVNEGGIRDAWTLPVGAKLAMPGYPAQYAAKPAQACVAIGYLIHADGHTSDFALLRAWSASEPPQRQRDAYWGAFAGAASSALSQWRFQPRPEVATPRPVYSVATFVFATAAPLELRKRCAIPNLTQRIVELKQDVRSRRRIAANSVFDRLDIDPNLEVFYRDQQYERDAGKREYEPKLPPPPPAPPPQPNPPAGG